MKIAVVETNPANAEVLAYAASRRGHQVICLPRPERLLGNLPFEPAALLIGVASLEGLTVNQLAAIHESLPDATMIAICERMTPVSRIAALKAGVDAVIPSPYAPHDVVLQAETWERARGKRALQPAALTLKDMSIDLDRYAVVKNGKAITLTRLELRLLYCLCQHSPSLTPTERLLTFGWDGMDEPDASLIKTHISHIRKKLDEAGGAPLEIRSRQGVGYVLTAPGE